MARQSISLGTTPNDGTGDSPNVAGGKINANFIELYSLSAVYAVFITLTDYASATYTYYGGIKASNSGWQINRYPKSGTGGKTAATVTNNGSYTTLAAAWAARTGLTYA